MSLYMSIYDSLDTVYMFHYPLCEKRRFNQGYQLELMYSLIHESIQGLGSMS